jgi:hypothetical protein
MLNFSSYLLSSAYSSILPLFNLGSSVASVSNAGDSLNAIPVAIFTLFGFFWFITLALGILIFVSLWKIFVKAGKPGWASFIPIYNTILLLEITNKPTWWIILMFIPFVNIVIAFMLTYDLAVSFGKDIGFTIGLILLPYVFYPILAFGDSQYIGINSNMASV